MLESCESEPSAAILKVTTVEFEATPANRNFPSGEAVSEISPNPKPTLSENGEPETGVSAPLLGSIEKPAIVCEPPLAA